MVGDIASIIVTVEFAVTLLPQSSVDVNITVYTPVIPQAASIAPSPLFVIVTDPQLSVPVACANHVSMISSLSSPWHSKVIASGTVNVGSVVSSIVNVAAVVEVVPQASVAVNVTSASPVAPHRLDSPVKLCVHVISPHRSDAAAPP